MPDPAQSDSSRVPRVVAPFPAAYRKMSAMAELRALGGVAGIAADMGDNPALRFRLTRALDRVARSLRLEE